MLVIPYTANTKIYLSKFFERLDVNVGDERFVPFIGCEEPFSEVFFPSNKSTDFCSLSAITILIVQYVNISIGIIVVNIKSPHLK